jgi:hypothetical protein
MLLVAGLIACGSDSVDIGPTIADLEEQPPLLATADPEPQVTFQVDRQQRIDSFRDLLDQITLHKPDEQIQTTHYCGPEKLTLEMKVTQRPQ